MADAPTPLQLARHEDVVRLFEISLKMSEAIKQLGELMKDQAAGILDLQLRVTKLEKPSA